jgi:hypothetical protein
MLRPVATFWNICAAGNARSYETISDLELLAPFAVTTRLLDIVMPEMNLQCIDEVEAHFVDAAALWPI